MLSGADISKGLTELWLCKEIPWSIFSLGRGRDKGASCLQLNPERFYILKGELGQEREKEERDGKLEQNRERERKLEWEREGEKRKKEGLKQNTNLTFWESRESSERIHS